MCTCVYIFIYMGKVMHMPGISMEVRRSEDNLRCWSSSFTLFETRSGCGWIPDCNSTTVGSSLRGLLGLVGCQPSSCFNERSCLKRVKWRVIEQDAYNRTVYWFLYIHAQVHAFAHAHIYIPHATYLSLTYMLNK